MDILNLSFSASGIIDNYDAAFFRRNLPQTIAALAQTQTKATEKKILVWAAGNAHGQSCTTETYNCENGTINATSVEILAGMVARIEELQGHSIAVVAVDQDGDIADFSNRCGIIAANWCLAAPGENVTVASSSGRPRARGIGFARGTSFAAPMVSGSLAVMKQLFRDQLPNTALVTRLFNTPKHLSLIHI